MKSNNKYWHSRFTEMGWSLAGHPYRTITSAQASFLVGLSTKKIIDMARKGQFPALLKLSKRRYGFVYKEVVAWLEERVRQRDSKFDSTHSKGGRGERRPSKGSRSFKH